MNILITKKQKEVLIAINKMLIDILSTKENVKPKLATRITAHSLEKLVNKVKDIDNLHVITESSKKLQVCVSMIKYHCIYNFLIIYIKFRKLHKYYSTCINTILLQVMLGIIQALTSEKTSQLDLLISLEKLVLQNIAVSRDSTNVLGQVIIEFSSFSISRLYLISSRLCIRSSFEIFLV